MNRRFLLITVSTMLVFSPLFQACNKEGSNNMPPSSNQQQPVLASSAKMTVDKINTLAAKYYSKENKYILAPDPWTTMLHDACGAMSGAWLGPFGAFAGATTASVCHAFGGSLMVASDDNSENTDNPYDVYGEMHNAAAYYLATNISSYKVNNVLENSLVVEACREYGVDNYSATLTDASSTSDNDIETILTMLGSEEDASVLLDNMETAGYINSEENDIMDSYFSGLVNASDQEAFSIGAEAIVLASTELSSTSKMKILIAMSVARNSLVLWSE